MKNTTNIKIPKKYQHMITLVERNDDMSFNEGKMYWVHAKEGYSFDGVEEHVVCEPTQKELMFHIKHLQKCKCCYKD